MSIIIGMVKEMDVFTKEVVNDPTKEHLNAIDDSFVSSHCTHYFPGPMSHSFNELAAIFK